MWVDWVKVTVAVSIMAVVSVSCGTAEKGSPGLQAGPDQRETPNVVSGEDALRLYGITPDPSPVPTPTVLDQTWFPRSAWVTASIMPYEDQAPIRILPVYSDPTLDLDGTWLGDLQEGDRVDLISVDPSARSCFVDGEATQGWPVEGWVACNRLSFGEPTAVPGA